MEEQLISKKDLLEITGISYGQLYRWKRKNVIPEEWFIKKSSYTGQETFFPKDKILDRIDKILNMKEDLSLDDLAEVFSPKPSKVSITKEELIEKGMLSERTIKLYEESCGELEKFDFDNILNPYILESFLKSGEITLEEGKALAQILTHEKLKEETKLELMLIRKFGIGIWIIGNINQPIIVDKESKIIIKTSLLKFVEELKLKLE